MVFRRTTWVMVLLFGILFAIAIFLQKNPAITAGLRTPTPTSYPNLINGFKPELVSQINIEPTSGDPFSLIRNPDSSWTITNQKQPVDAGKVEQLFTALLDLKTFSVLDKTISPDSLGLLSPEATVSFQFVDGEPLTMKIGNPTSTESGYYIQVNDNLPVVVGMPGIDSIREFLRMETLLVPQPTSNPMAPPSVDLPTPVP